MADALPSQLKDLSELAFVPRTKELLPKERPEIARLFPKSAGQPELVLSTAAQAEASTPVRVGALFSGGPASGGHNVIAGLFDALQGRAKGSALIGFLGGPAGLVEGSYKELKADEINAYRDTGGFHLLGTGRTKIETDEQKQKAKEVCKQLKLDALVIIGGDDSNTNAALLAEYFMASGVATRVIGVPKTIDGDLKNAAIEATFGFSTACEVFSTLIANLQRDAASVQKYTHLVRLMGRSASHITLACARATKPDLFLISEQAAAEKKTLPQVVAQIADLVEARAHAGQTYGVILIPEGLIEFLVDMRELIRELNALLAAGSAEQAKENLQPASKALLASLPQDTQKQLLFDRDPHGNVRVSQIETERLLAELVTKELADRKSKAKFSPLTHFYGYEGRCAHPNAFDRTYAYVLGMTAGLLALTQRSGYIVAVQRVYEAVDQWVISAEPLTRMIDLEVRKGVPKPVIQKNLVDPKTL